MSKRRPPTPAPRTKAEALARVAQLERQVRSLKRQLESSARRADDAVRESAETRRELTGTREQQAATAEILRVMSASPGDVQPVLDVIARHAVQLCQGYFSAVFLSDGALIDVRATHNLPPEWLEVAQDIYPVPLEADVRPARVVRERRVIQFMDLQSDPEVPEEERQRARVGGYRTWIGAPLLGSSGAVGVIGVGRRERQAFCRDGDRAAPDLRRPGRDRPRERAPVQGARRRATPISPRRSNSRRPRPTSCGSSARSPTNLQPVLETIVRSAARLLRILRRGNLFEFDDVPRFGSPRTSVRYPALVGSSIRSADGGAVVGRATVLDRPDRSRGRSPGRRAGVPGRRALSRSSSAIRTALSGSAAAGGDSRRCDPAPPHRGEPVHRQADRPPADLRRPGGDRDRERAAVQGAAGAQPELTESLEQQTATGRSSGRSAAPRRMCSRSSMPSRERGPAERRALWVRLPVRRRADSHGRPAQLFRRCARAHSANLSDPADPSDVHRARGARTRHRSCRRTCRRTRRPEGAGHGGGGRVSGACSRSRC